MKWIVMPAVLAGVVALSGPAASQSLSGCWHYSDGSVFSTVCFGGGGSGTFNLEYALEDANQGLVKGSCNGGVEVTDQRENGVDFTVPYQEEACRQEDQVFRVAKRDYSCEREEFNKMVCNLIVYYDDGTIFSEAVGIEYSR